MAIATLDTLANNANVYTGVLKIRKGQALRLLMDGECVPVLLRLLKTSAL